MNTWRTTIGLAVMAAGLLLGGCAAMRGDAFGRDNLPRHQYMVGGGTVIDFTAPVDGVFYLVDADPGRVVVTKMLKAGKGFDMNLTENVEELQQLLGRTEVATARLSYYFIPNTEFRFEDKVLTAPTKAPATEKAEKEAAETNK